MEFSVRVVELLQRGSVGVVRVELADGTVGYGQLGEKDIGLSAWLLEWRVTPAVLGVALRSPLEIYDVVLAFEVNYKQMGVQLNKAIAGLDSAVWDALARRRGKSVFALWDEIFFGSMLEKAGLSSGGGGGGVPVYASSITRGIKPSGLGERLLGIRKAHGIEAFKVKTGVRMSGATAAGMGKKSGDSSSVPGDVEEIRKIRKILDGCKVALDGNGAYTFEEAEKLLKEVGKENIWFFEELLPWYKYSEMRRLFAPTRNQSSQGIITLAGGEQEFRMDMWEDLVLGPDSGRNCFMIVQPDIGYCGGPSNALKIITLMGKHRENYLFMPHSPQGDLHLAMAAHLVLLYNSLRAGKPESFLEFACVDDGYQQVKINEKTGDFLLTAYKTPLGIRDGRLSTTFIEKGLGWGLEIDEAWLAESTKTRFPDPTKKNIRSFL